MDIRELTKANAISDELVRIQKKLNAVSVEFRNYKNWHEEFYERLEADHPDILSDVLDKMGGGKDALPNETCKGKP